LLSLLCVLSAPRRRRAAVDPNDPHAFLLIEDNFDWVTEGKGSFIKFLGPGPENCDDVKLAWHDLAVHYQTNYPTAPLVIGTVNCTSSATLCTRLNVKVDAGCQLRHMKAGDTVARERYVGQKDILSLVYFARDQVLEPCSHFAAHDCLKDERGILETYRRIDAEERRAQLVQKNFEGRIEALQKEYDELEKALQEAKDRVIPKGLEGKKGEHGEPIAGLDRAAMKTVQGKMEMMTQKRAEMISLERNRRLREKLIAELELAEKDELR